jgi:hypothetical protein
MGGWRYRQLVSPDLNAESAAMNSKQTRLPVILGAIAAAVHLVLCLAVNGGFFSSEGSWNWFIPFMIDFPASILLLPLQGHVSNLVSFGVFGSAWWFLIVWGISRIVTRRSRATHGSG